MKLVGEKVIKIEFCQNYGILNYKFKHSRNVGLSKSEIEHLKVLNNNLLYNVMNLFFSVFTRHSDRICKGSD